MLRSKTKVKMAKKPTTKKKTSRTDLARPTPESPLALSKVVCRRVQDYGQIASSSSAPTFVGIVFSLVNVQNYNELTVLYDQYQIEEVCMIFKPINKYLAPSGASAQNPTFMVHAIDFDDATAPTTLGEMWEKSLVDIHYYYDEWKVQFKPRAAQALYNTSATFSGYAQNVSPWIDCASSSVEHYGFKAVIPQSTATTITGWRLYIVYKLAFRYLR